MAVNVYDSRLSAGPHRFGSLIIQTPREFANADAALKSLASLFCTPLHSREQAKSGVQRWQIVAELTENVRDTTLSFVGQDLRIQSRLGQKIVIEYEIDGKHLSSFRAHVQRQ